MGNHPGASSRREALPLLGLKGKGERVTKTPRAIALEKLRYGLWP